MITAESDAMNKITPPQEKKTKKSIGKIASDKASSLFKQDSTGLVFKHSRFETAAFSANTSETCTRIYVYYEAGLEIKKKTNVQCV
jgi:hypothetical protein